jgi:hypothetical protein
MRAMPPPLPRLDETEKARLATVNDGADRPASVERITSTQSSKSTNQAMRHVCSLEVELGGHLPGGNDTEDHRHHRNLEAYVLGGEIVSMNANIRDVNGSDSLQDATNENHVHTNENENGSDATNTNGNSDARQRTSSRSNATATTMATETKSEGKPEGKTDAESEFDSANKLDGEELRDFILKKIEAMPMVGCTKEEAKEVHRLQLTGDLEVEEDKRLSGNYNSATTETSRGSSVDGGNSGGSSSSTSRLSDPPRRSPSRVSYSSVTAYQSHLPAFSASVGNPNRESNDSNALIQNIPTKSESGSPDQNSPASPNQNNPASPTYNNNSPTHNSPTTHNPTASHNPYNPPGTFYPRSMRAHHPLGDCSHQHRLSVTNNLFLEPASNVWENSFIPKELLSTLKFA